MEKTKYLVTADGGPAAGEQVTILKRFNTTSLVQRPDGRAVTVDSSRLSPTTGPRLSATERSFIERRIAEIEELYTELQSARARSDISLFHATIATARCEGLLAEIAAYRKALAT